MFDILIKTARNFWHSSEIKGYKQFHENVKYLFRTSSSILYFSLKKTQNTKSIFYRKLKNHRF